MISQVRTGQSVEELLARQRDVDAIIREALDCHDDGAVDEENLAAFGLVLERSIMPSRTATRRSKRSHPNAPADA